MKETIEAVLIALFIWKLCGTIFSVFANTLVKLIFHKELYDKEARMNFKERLALKMSEKYNNTNS